MRKFHFSTALAIAFFCLTQLTVAQQARDKPMELQVLDQYVGDWTSDVTSKPAVWTPEEKNFRTSNHAEFVLDDWFLQHIEVNHVVGDPQKMTKALWFQTFDPQTERFVMWFFQSTGMIGQSSGKWDQKINSLSFTPTDLPPNATGKHTESFSSDHTITGSYLVTETDGTKLFDMVWIRNRQAGIAGQPTRERWAKLGTPIEPVPADVKKLQPFIGDWDSEVIQRPSVVSPSGNTSKGTMSAQWILDGRFLLGKSEVGNHTSKWVIGYDTYKEAYRFIRFTNTGQIDDSTGQWNEETRSFVWKLVNTPAGITRTSTTRIVGNDAVHAHILSEDSDGQVQLDLTIRSTRRK